MERANGQTLINYYGYENPVRWSKTDTQRVGIKKLLYKFGNFVEYNPAVQHHNIKKLEFSTTMCFGSCPVFILSIDSNRSAWYDAKRFNDVTGLFHTTIDDVYFNEIMQLADYIDFPKLEDDYSVSWKDDQTGILTITYDHGKVKRIRDYGLLGTFGLRRLYDLLFELRSNQKWHQ